MSDPVMQVISREMMERAAAEVERLRTELAETAFVANERSADITELRDEVEELRAALVRKGDQIEACRQFAARHPALTDVDRAEFEAFLKVPDAIRVGMSN